MRHRLLRRYVSTTRRIEPGADDCCCHCEAVIQPIVILLVILSIEQRSIRAWPAIIVAVATVESEEDEEGEKEEQATL